MKTKKAVVTRRAIARKAVARRAIALGLIALVLGIASCDSNTYMDLAEGKKDAFLTGTVAISPSGGAKPGDWLTAAYSGSENVSYQWYKDGAAITGATGRTYNTTEAGNYTVTVSAAGFKSITSASVSVVTPTDTGDGGSGGGGGGGGTGGGGGGASTVVAVTGVTLDKTTAGIAAAGTETLTATIAPAGATNKAVSWSTSDPTKATVSSTGVVTGVASGTATITVTTADGGFTADCAVTVGPAVLSGIAVTTQPERTAYGLNSTEAADPTDLTGMVLTLTYSDGTTATVSYAPADAALYGVANFDRTSIGAKTADVTYGGKTDTGGITGLGVFNIVAERTAVTPHTYHGYNTLTAAIPGSGGEQGQTAVITLYAGIKDSQSGTASPYSLGTGTDIILTGYGAAAKTIEGDAAAAASLFFLDNGAKLTLGIRVGDNSITIKGQKITSSSHNVYGGAVYGSGGSIFTMNGGEISGNSIKSTVSSSASSSANGGGVCVVNSTFIMNGGTIKGNIAAGSSNSYGGGVCVWNSTFTMNDGTIEGNSLTANALYNHGGGVYINGGTFTMNDGKISGNLANVTTTTNYGGGVYINGGTFTMNDGEISGNSAQSVNDVGFGGGVCVSDGFGTAYFTMKGGNIKDNTASRYGGGVFFNSGGIFTALSPVDTTAAYFSGNTANSSPNQVLSYGTWGAGSTITSNF